MIIRMSKNRLFTVAGGLMMAYALSYGTGEDVGFDSGRWQLGPASRVEEYLGRQALTLSGTAFVKDVEFLNGIVEVDVACEDGSVFPTIVFRRRDAANYEEFYIRPHKSGQPDALQYSPVFNGLSAWQLYYGDGYTNAWTLPKNEWIHLKLEIAGKQARVFVGDGESPALQIDDLKLEPAKGGLGLKVTGPIGLAHFSDFRFRPDESLSFDHPVKTETPFGMITNWELSQSFPYNLLDGTAYPPQDLLARVTWKGVASEPVGLVNVSRYAVKGPVVPGVVLARTTIHADEERPMKLQFGYSDIVSIFCNGRLAFRGSNVFQSRDPFFQGRVGLFDAVYLPLTEGSNEILLVLAESMGGWGFMCRDGDAVFMDEGLTKLWELSGTFSWPETVLYDMRRDVLYVSNLYTDGTQFLSKVNPDGRMEAREWVKGLNRPTGMVLQDDKIFVVERADIAEIDIPSGQIVKRHPVPSPGFLNDIAADGKGVLYISDSQKGQILKFQGGEISTWMSGGEFAGVNGLHFLSGQLYAGFSSDASLRTIDPQSGEIRTVSRLDRGAIVDGVESDTEGNLLVSDYNGKIYRVGQTGRTKLLLDSTAPGHFCANFAYVPGKEILVVPSLNDNRVIAYRLNMK